MTEVDDFLRVIDEELARLGETDRSLSLRATSSADTIRNARRNRALPSPRNLARLADALNLSLDQLQGRAPGEPPRAVEITPAPGVGDVSRAFRSGGRGLPVLGTALGHNMDFDDSGTAEVEVTLIEQTEVIHYVARPPALLGNDEAYAFYVQGDSMAPAHKPGALRIANPKVVVSIHDDVVVQLRAPIDDGESGQEVVSVLIKTLVRRSGSFIELEQINPPKRFRVPSDRIAAIHRVMELGELLG